MQQLPKEFVGRMVRTVLFIGLVAACCAGSSREICGIPCP